jgi:hypothetical protein
MYLFISYKMYLFISYKMYLFISYKMYLFILTFCFFITFFDLFTFCCKY